MTVCKEGRSAQTWRRYGGHDNQPIGFRNDAGVSMKSELCSKPAVLNHLALR